jgi:hypothetical protein
MTNLTRLFIAGIAASILFLVLDATLGMVGGLVEARVFGLSPRGPSQIQSKMAYGLVFEFINGFMLAVVYAVICSSLPGQGLAKGISFGFLVWGLRVVMWAFSTYMMFDVPAVSIAITTFTGLIEVLVLGVTIAAIYPST